MHLEGAGSPSDAVDEWAELFSRVTFRTIVAAAIQEASSSNCFLINQ